MAIQQPTNDQLAPYAERYDLTRKNNLYLDPDNFECEYPIWVHILRQHKIWYAMSGIERVSETYLQQFWRNITLSADKSHCTTRINTTEVTITKALLQQILDLGAVNAEFEPELTKAQLPAAINQLGYAEPMVRLSQFVRKNLAEPWNTLFTLINKCLSPKHSGHDRANIHVYQLFANVAYHRRGNYALLIWRDFLESVQTKDTPKRDARVLPYQRITGLIIQHFRVQHPAIIERTDFFLPDQLRRIIKTRVPVVDMIWLIPLELLMLGQRSDLVNRYWRKYYNGNQVRATPLSEEELDALVVEPKQEEAEGDEDQPVNIPQDPPQQPAAQQAQPRAASPDSKRTVSGHVNEGQADDEETPTPPTPRTKAALIAQRQKSKHHVVMRKRKTRARPSGLAKKRKPMTTILVVGEGSSTGVKETPAATVQMETIKKAASGSVEFNVDSLIQSLQVSPVKSVASVITTAETTISVTAASDVSDVLIDIPLTFPGFVTEVTTSAVPPPIFSSSTAGPSVSRETSDKGLQQLLEEHRTQIQQSMLQSFEKTFDASFGKLREDLIVSKEHVDLRQQLRGVSTDDMVAALFIRLLEENPDSNATDLESFYVEKHERCKRAADKGKDVRDDDDDSADPFGGQLRKSGGVVIQEPSSTPRSTTQETSTQKHQSTSGSQYQLESVPEAPIVSDVDLNKSPGTTVSSDDSLLQEVENYTADQGEPVDYPNPDFTFDDHFNMQQSEFEQGGFGVRTSRY